MYAITAQVGTRQVPTFYLDENVQGIVDEQGARNVAFQIVTACNPHGAPIYYNIDITAVKGA